MKDNQKKLYDHFIKLSKEGKTDKQRAFGLQSANDILKSFPDFAGKKERPETAAETKAREKAEKEARGN